MLHELQWLIDLLEQFRVWFWSLNPLGESGAFSWEIVPSLSCVTVIVVVIWGTGVPARLPFSLPRQLWDRGLHTSQVSILCSGVLSVTIFPEQEMSWTSQNPPKTYCLSLSFQEEWILWGWGRRCLLELSIRIWVACVNLTTGVEWLPLRWEQGDGDWRAEYWHIDLIDWVVFKIFTAYRVLTDTELWKLLFKQIEYSL